MATVEEFAQAVSPLLTLVAPTGMTQDERKGWLHAAMMALDDLTPAALSRGVREAMRTVDHPSKIVAAIRKANEGGYKSMPTTIRPPGVPVTAIAGGTNEVAGLISGLAKQLSAKRH